MDVAWDDLRTVLAMVRQGSLAGAGNELGLNYTTVSRRLKRAETALGQTLFERLADGYVPTETARLIAEHAAEMEQQEHALMRKVQGADTDLGGEITITAPQLLIASFLAPVLDQFNLAYPKINLHIRATNELLDLSRREADLAIRISRNPGDTLTGLRLCRQDSASFATPSWAERIKNAPQERIDWIVYESYPDVPVGCDPEYTNMRVRLRFDDMVAMIGAAQAGLGIVRMPMFLGRSTPGLVQVPVLPPQPYPDIWVVGHADVWPSGKLKVFREILVAHCRAHRDLFVA